MNWAIREETPGDEAAIHAVTKRAFIDQPYSDGDEAEVIDKLREDGDLLLSLVAVFGDEIVGQVIYSRAKLSNGDDGWMVAGPIAVAKEYRGRGIGRALLEAGEAKLRASGAKGITVLGDPELYRRFGYLQHTAMKLAGELGQFLQVKSFGEPIPSASITFAPAFG